MMGLKKYYSNKYEQRGNFTYYQVNPVLIIYINDTYLRIINQDGEGLYCFDNRVETPRYEITDREPNKGAKNYRDILFYIYDANVFRNIKRRQRLLISNVKIQKEVFLISLNGRTRQYHNITCFYKTVN